MKKQKYDSNQNCTFKQKNKKMQPSFKLIHVKSKLDLDYGE